MSNTNISTIFFTNDDYETYDKESFVQIVGARALEPQRVEQFGQYIADARAFIDINPKWALGAMRMMLEYALYECQEKPKDDYLDQLVEQWSGPDQLKQAMKFLQHVGNDGAHPARPLSGKGWRLGLQLLTRIELEPEADIAPRGPESELEQILAELAFYVLYSVLGWLVLPEGEHLWDATAPDAPTRKTGGA